MAPHPQRLMLLSVALAIFMTLSVFGQGDNDRLRILYIGDYRASNPGVVAIESDPKILPFYVPATTGWFGVDEIQRAMRLYLPRNYDAFVHSKDMTVLSDADPWSLPQFWDSYIERSVSEDGLSVLMTGGHRGLGGSGASREQWENTRVSDVLPVTIISSSIIGEIGLGATLRAIVAIPKDPLMRSLPWESCPPFTEINEVVERQGAVTPFVLKKEGNSPVISYWDYEKGRSLIFAADWHGFATRAVQYWQFFDDAVIDMVYYAGKLELPPDPIIANQLRSSFKKFRLMEAGFNSVLEFVEKFGANTLPIRGEMEQVRILRREGEGLYLRQKYIDALAKMDDATKALEKLEKKAVSLQKSALLWVYVIEWFAVTATCMLAGFALYELMIKRRLFKQLGTTRRKAD